MVDSLLYWLSESGKAYRLAQDLHLPEIVTSRLARPDGVARARGFEFFPNRDSLHKAHGTLSSRFETVSSVSAIWVVGQKFYHAGEKLDVVKELLLPHPDGESLKYHAKVSNHSETERYIRDATQVAIKRGTKVKWYRHFIFNSIILADIDKPSGWIHVEICLPYSKPEKRPSYTVYKKRSEEVVTEMHRIFREIWEEAGTLRT